MRPGQNNNNKRMRGRPTNNRRGPNPLTRSYESNGPDVKIRGNAHHVAEKYLQLARDAHTGGDPVAAENYLQHAEHYFRLIAAAQAAQLAAQGRPPGEVDESEDDDEDGGVLDRFASPVERVQPYTPPPQPVANGAPYSGYPERQPFEGQPQQPERNGFQPRPQQHNNRHENRNPRPFQERGDGQRDFRNGQNDGRPREFRPYRDPNSAPSPVPNPAPSPAREPQPLPPRDSQPLVEATPSGLPAFITRAPTGVEAPDAPQPVIETIEAPIAATEVLAGGSGEEPQQEARFPRGRRRRLRSPYGFQSGGDEAPAPAPPSNEPSSAD